MNKLKNLVSMRNKSGEEKKKQELIPEKNL